MRRPCRHGADLAGRGTGVAVQLCGGAERRRRRVADHPGRRWIVRSLTSSPGVVKPMLTWKSLCAPAAVSSGAAWSPVKTERLRRRGRDEACDQGDPHRNARHRSELPHRMTSVSANPGLQVRPGPTHHNWFVPTYEYRCSNGHTFEVFQSMSDDPVTACQECGAPVERVFHPVAVHFKGSGFYTTDYARKGSAKQPRRRVEGRVCRRRTKEPGTNKKQAESSSKQGESSSESELGLATGAHCGEQAGVLRGCGRGTASPPARTRPADDEAAERAGPDGLRTSVPESPPRAAEEDQLRHGEGAHVADERLRRVPGDNGPVRKL